MMSLFTHLYCNHGCRLHSQHEGKVETLDQNSEKFICLKKKNGWPMVINYNVINGATKNAFVIMRGSGKRDRKTEFRK